MTPDLIGKHAYQGSEAVVRCGDRRRRGLISHCSANGDTLYARLYGRCGYNLSESPIPIPAACVVEIIHGVASFAPKRIKRSSVGGVR